MKKFIKSFPLSKTNPEESSYPLPHLSPRKITTDVAEQATATPIDGKVKGPHTYTNWIPKVLASASQSQTTASTMSDQYKNAFGKNKKPPPTLLSYEKILTDLVVTQCEQNLEQDEFLKKNPKYKKLTSVGNKLNLKKYTVHFLEWKVHATIFLTRKEFRLKVVKSLTSLWPRMVEHVKENFLTPDNVEYFWKSVELLSEEVWTEMISKYVNQLISPAAKAILTDPDLLLDAGLFFLGQIWTHFNSQTPVPLLDDETDSIARFQMETLLGKFETEVTTNARRTFAQEVPDVGMATVSSGVSRLCEVLKNNKEYWTHVLNGYKIKLHLYNIIYSVWDLEISKIIPPILKTGKSQMIPVKFLDRYPILTQNFDAERDIALFSVFRALRKFANLTALPGLSDGYVKPSVFNWFRDFVPQWIDVACYRAMTRIEIAVKQDNLEPITALCKRSYSSTFTVDIFSQMETSWHELDWPNPEESFSYAVLTLKNFDRCIQFYTETICNRLEEVEADTFYNFGPSDELFIAINNVEYVSKNVTSIAQNLGITRLIQKLEAEVMIEKDKNLTMLRNHSSIEQCLETPPNIIENWKENVHRRVSTCLILTYDKQIEPLVDMFLETAHNTETVRDSDKIIIHLSGILERMTAKLNSTEYARAFPTIADRILDSFLDYAKTNVLGVQSFHFFQHLEDLLTKICALFQKVGMRDLITKREEEIGSLQESLKLYKISTEKLIVEYLQARYDAQVSSEMFCQEGFLTVIVNYSEDTQVLQVQTLNASLLKQEDVNSYVRFKIYPNSPTLKKGEPESRFSQVYKRSKYPLYQETFEINIPQSDINSGGFIHFWIKIGTTCRWKFIGESFLPLDKFLTQTDTQIRLPLTLPTRQNLHILDILDNRKDKSGTKFSARQRYRISLNK